MARAESAGKVFIDRNQNAEYKTTVAAYSMGAKHSHPYLSRPITWEEAETAAATGQVNELIFFQKRLSTVSSKKGTCSHRC